MQTNQRAGYGSIACMYNYHLNRKVVKKLIVDIITTAPEDKVTEAQNIFNQNDELGRLKFTYEVQLGNKINFLDMTLIHMRNQKIKTNWYARTTSSKRIVNFLSSHPPKMKENAIGLINRVITLSDPIFRPMNTARIYEILRKNNYRTKIIEKAMAVYHYRQQQKTEQQTELNGTREKLTRIYRTYHKR